MPRVTNPLKLALQGSFRPLGYEFCKGDWIRRCEEVVQLVNLQCEPGDQYFLNASCWICKLGLPASLKERYGHYRFRINWRVDPRFDELLNVFANQDSIRDEERETRCRELLQEKAIPLLDRLTSVEQLRNAYLAKLVRNVAIVREASLYLFGCAPPPRLSDC